ncbi:hypothetical protein SAMN04487948_10381 [Halogranum amylolyticum]|uniref:Uncharacterized protein n=1 Tax=Halogranum amylolyticum TaxID=660520 RepID=A0A1H8QFB3_9EURY|nr:hypothetical protein [Halogranum amylolyticum]SEO52726.1 hypothetical protein SAMN04487948_10381 [Halogranum amylolyticum]
MDDPRSYDVLLRPTPDDRARPGRAFLTDDALLLAPSRHGRLARVVGDAANGLFGHLPESLGLYDPHAVTRTEAIHGPETLRIRYADLRALAPFVRPTGFSLHLRVDGRSDDVRLAFRSNDERRETVELARELRRRASEAGVEVDYFDPGGRTRLLPLDEGT